MATGLVDVECADGMTRPLTILTQMHSSQDEIKDNIVANMARWGHLPRFP